VVTALYGDGGVGKSLLAQQLLTCTAMTLPWLGLETRGGRALGMFCEDSAEELERRQWDINAALGVDPATLENLRLVSRLGEDNTLFAVNGERGETTPLFDALAAKCAEVNPRLIVLDTAADLFGGNENNRQHVRAFIASCLGRLARDHDAGVVLCAHPSATGLANGQGTGGSTAWNNTVRSRWYLTRSAEEGAPPSIRTLARKKNNYGPQDAGMDITWRAGAFALLAAADKAAGSAQWPAIYAMFDEIKRAWEAGNPWSPASQTRESGRYFPHWMKAQHGIPERQAKALLQEWLTSGCLVVEQVDRHSKKNGLKVLRRPDQ
jgi:RecA-family ATPase